MADIGKLSSSKATTYKGCSMAYYLQYVVHEEAPNTVTLGFGGRIHMMLEKFYKVNYKSAESFVKSWRYQWGMEIAGENLKGTKKERLEVRDVKYMGKDKDTGKKVEKVLHIGNHYDLFNFEDPVGVFFGAMRVGDDILKRFYERHKDKPKPFAVEKSFGRKKDEPFKIGDHLITGVFDRIDNIDGKWYITDYKTDKSSPEKDSFILHRNLQFTLYSYVFRELFGFKEEAILYYHLRSGGVFKTHRSEKDFDYLKLFLDEVAEGVSNDRFVPFYGFHCKFCKFKAACEKYSIDYFGGPRIDLEGRIIGAQRFEGWDQEIPDWMYKEDER